MDRRTFLVVFVLLALGLARLAGAQEPFSLAPTTQPDVPELSTDTNSDEGIYTMPQPPLPGQGTNQGGVNFNLDLSYFNQYVYRGVDHSIGEAKPSGVFTLKGSTLNFQVDTNLHFDLGKFPHPFLGLFTDVYDADPVNKFQEVRPYYGLEWEVKPFTLIGGGNTYIYPGRTDLNTAEYFGKFSFNDSLLFHSATPIFSPYYYAAYDYDKNKGWYMEGGITHDFPFEDFGVTFTTQADVAYIMGYQEQFVFINEFHDTGWQHYDLGFKLAYSLNHLFNLGQRYGQFDILASIFYTGTIDGDLTANNILWGGVGIGFSY
ncbi:MAG TPA: hypothetical protein VL992_20070 [Tepidisphaeraceae bacterium]|nr:hypothetical protein [Tepidisphaeraceae bacterium]